MLQVCELLLRLQVQGNSVVRFLSGVAQGIDQACVYLFVLLTWQILTSVGLDIYVCSDSALGNTTPFAHHLMGGTASRWIACITSAAMH